MDQKENISVLFAEDETDIRNRYCQILKERFENVYEASNGIDAYKIFSIYSPSILIVDINMPEMDGLELIKKIRKTDKNCKIIILTAHTQVDYLLEAAELLLTKYLVKPVKRRDFNEAVQMAVDDLNSVNIISKKVMTLTRGYSWDFTNNNLLFNNKEVELTKSEKIILNTLFSNPNMELTYDDLIYPVWNDYDHSRKDTLKTMINNLRKKLPKDTIKTMYSIGYRFDKD
jgi:DNA-binding response OmpR family regulator